MSIYAPYNQCESVFFLRHNLCRAVVNLFAVMGGRTSWELEPTTSPCPVILRLLSFTADSVHFTLFYCVLVDCVLLRDLVLRNDFHIK